MPPRAFPYPLRVGIDICHIPRIHSLLTRKADKIHPLNQFLTRVLTWPERQYFWDRFGDRDKIYEQNLGPVARFLAGRQVFNTAIVFVVADPAIDGLRKRLAAKHATTSEQRGASSIS